MYQLVKGREAVKTGGDRGRRTRREPQPMTEPIQPWVSPPPPAAPGSSDTAPAAVVAADAGPAAGRPGRASRRPRAPLDNRPLVATNVPIRPGRRKPPTGHSEADRRRASTPSQPRRKPRESRKAEATRPESGAAPPRRRMPARRAGQPRRRGAEAERRLRGRLPAGAVGLAEEARRRPAPLQPEQREWERLTDATPLREQDRLLEPRAVPPTLELGTADVDLVGETEIWLTPRPDLRGAADLTQGRVVFHGTSPGLPFEIHSGGETVKITPPAGVDVGVERVNRRARASPRPASVLRVFAADGPVAGDRRRRSDLTRPGPVTVEADGKSADSPQGRTDVGHRYEPAAVRQRVGRAVPQVLPLRPADHHEPGGGSRTSRRTSAAWRSRPCGQSATSPSSCPCSTDKATRPRRPPKAAIGVLASSWPRAPTRPRSFTNSSSANSATSRPRSPRNSSSATPRRRPADEAT